MKDIEKPTRRRAKSVRIGMYTDIREILDAALAAGGGVYSCETYGKAVHWRHEAYKFRKLFADQRPNLASPYDRLILRAIEPGETFVRIDIRESKGVFTPNQLTSSPLSADEQAMLFSIKPPTNFL